MGLQHTTGETKMSNRAESIQIRMKLDKAAYDRHEKAYKTVVTDFDLHVVKGDKLKLKYDFFIHYFGDIAAKLAAIKVICNDSDVVVEAECNELVEGRILIYEVLRELDNVIQIVKERNGDMFPWRRCREEDPKPNSPTRTWRQWWRGE
jgi:hypothetical protein